MRIRVAHIHPTEPTSNRRMYGLCFVGHWRHFLLVIWFWLLAPPKGLGYFLGDTKAVLNGCEDHWTLQDRAAMPLLFHMTVCVDIRVVVPGAWVAFSYSSVHASRPELGLEGDEVALYGWLLRVRHRFPLQLSPTHWHRVCLRRDVLRNSFSLEVDGKSVAERTVIARAIPPSGSLWLGCRPRDRPPGAALGQVELYLFRVWADVGDHGPCEDGAVIGWNAHYWGLTSPRARERDASLPCAFPTGLGRLFTAPPNVSSTTSSPVIATPVTPVSNRTSQVTGSTFVKCDISQLCSNENAYYWMSISVTAEGGSKTEKDVLDLVSNAFGCHGDGDGATRKARGFMDSCQVDRRLQVVQVNCEAKSNIRETTCDVLLQLSPAVSACELQRDGVSALQQSRDQHIRATIIRGVERVGRDLCEDASPSSGRFMRCSSTTSLDDVCQAGDKSSLTCSLIEPNSNRAPEPDPESCSRESPRLCDCTAFCNTTSQFFAIRIHISSASVNVNLLKTLLLGQNLAHMCDTMSGSMCQESEILKSYEDAHLECHETPQRSYSCMVILEMSGPVNSCSLNDFVQNVIDSSVGITKERPLTRVVVCGPPGLSARTLLSSNLTWVDSDLLTSDLCQPEPPLLHCEVNEKLAVLLPDKCPPTAAPPQPSITTTPEASPPTVTNTPAQTAESTVAAQQTNTSQGTPPLTINSTQSSTAQPVLQTSSQNTTAQNTTTTTENTQLQITTTANQNTTDVITLSNTILHISTPAPNDSKLNTTTSSPSNTTVQTTVDTFTPPNNATTYNITTVDTFTLSPNNATTYNITTVHTFTPSPNNATTYNITPVDAFTPSPNNATTYNVTTVDTFTPSPNNATTYNVTTVDTFTPSPNNATTYNVTTVDTFTPSPNNATTYNLTTVDTFTPSPNNATMYNVTTVDAFTPPNNATMYNVTTVDTASPTNTTVQITVDTFTPSPNNATMYNVTTVDTFTLSPNYIMANSVTTVTEDYVTASNNYPTEYNITATHNNRNLPNGTIKNTITAFPNYTMANNVTTAENTTTTTVSQNKTATDNVTTTGPYRNTTMSTNITTSTKTSTVDNMITTKPTIAPPNNQTVNHTTPATPNATATNKTDTSSTTAGSTTSTLTSDFNQMTNRVNLTTTVAFLGHTVTTSTTTTTSMSTTTTTSTSTTSTSTTTTTSTMQDPLLAQTNSTTAKVALTPSTSSLTTVSSTTIAKPGTGTTYTTTAQTTKSPETQEEQANELLDQTQDSSQLNSSQVAQVAGQLEKLLGGPTVSQAVGQKAVNIISNLMEGDSAALSASANRLIRVVDDLGLKLVVAGDSEIISSDSLLLAVRTVDGADFPTMSVNIFNTDNVQLRTLRRSRAKRSGSALGSVFLPSSLTTGLSPEQQHQASRVQFTFYMKSALFQDAALGNRTLVSPVLGSSVANLSIGNLSENIQFTIRNINPIHADVTASCVFWDFALNGGGGGWSSAGCFLVNVTPEDTTCSCNHLTSFAILLDLSREGTTDRQQAQILTFITYIGCGISAVFLAVTLLTYLCFEKLRRDIPAKILVQLCASLLLLNLVFLLDGWLALYPAPGLCISTAFFLHYFLLTSFTWAGLEAMHMYLCVVQVFTPYLSRYMLKFSLIGWGLPLVVVIVVISVDKENYGLVSYGKHTDDFCWLRSDIAFHVGVVAYFLLIFALCLLVFILVMVQLARIKKQNPQNRSPNRGVLTDLRSIAGLIILLGLTWGFALFAWGPLHLPFIYLFSIFNSLQGFLVFLFHCAVKENVRRQWRTYLCCGRLRLAENSEWSRTATQNLRNLSVFSAAPHAASRSSSVISNGTSTGTGSVFADSGTSDGSNSDVVLNEIHRSVAVRQGVTTASSVGL